MPAHLRVSLADRPGALAALTRGLAAAGANVLAVTVVQREAGRAVDDLLLDWPFARPWDAVVRAVEGCSGARVQGLRHIASAQMTPDADVVATTLRQPHRAVEALVDLLPGALLADWAAVADRRWPREPVLATHDSPLPLPLAPAALPRPRALVVGDEPLLALPCADSSLRLLVGRSGGPAFTRSERDRCTALLDVVISVTRLAYADATAQTAASVTATILDSVSAVRVG
jgi:hypothetical protein